MDGEFLVTVEKDGKSETYSVNEHTYEVVRNLVMSYKDLERAFSIGESN